MDCRQQPVRVTIRMEGDATARVSACDGDMAPGGWGDFAVTAARHVFSGHCGGPTCSRVWRSAGARRDGHPPRRPLVQPRDRLKARTPPRTMPPWLVRGARELATIRGH